MNLALMTCVTRRCTALFADRTNLLRLAGALLTGVLYTAALPPYNQQECGWFALVPLILIARHSTPRAADPGCSSEPRWRS